MCLCVPGTLISTWSVGNNGDSFMNYGGFVVRDFIDEKDRVWTTVGQGIIPSTFAWWLLVFHLARLLSAYLSGKSRDTTWREDTGFLKTFKPQIQNKMSLQSEIHTHSSGVSVSKSDPWTSKKGDIEICELGPRQILEKHSGVLELFQVTWGYFQEEQVLLWRSVAPKRQCGK